MGVSIRMVRAAAITGGGPSQTFTVPGWTETPKAAIFIMTGATTNLFSTLGASLMVGIATGPANRFCTASSSQDNVGNANTANRKSNTKCISFLGHVGTVNGEADFTSFGSGSVTVTWSSFPLVGFLVTVILFAGADLSAYAGDFSASGSVDTPTVVTAPGFQPDQLLLLGGGRSAGYNAIFNDALMQIGFADRGPPIAQCCTSWFSLDNAGSADCQNWVSTNRSCVGMSATGGLLGNTRIEITAFSGSGFTATTRTGGLAVPYPYLALSYTTVNGTCGHSVPVINPPGAPGTPTHFVGGTYTPQFVLQLPSGVNVPNALRNTGTTNAPGAGSYGIAAFTATELFSNCIGDDDAANTMATQSFVATDFRCRSDVGANLHIAASQTFGIGFYSLTYTTAVAAPSGTVRYWPTLVIGNFVSSGTAVPVYQHSYRQRRVWCR
jgi:hypothetical protein